MILLNGTGSLGDPLRHPTLTSAFGRSAPGVQPAVTARSVGCRIAGPTRVCQGPQAQHHEDVIQPLYDWLGLFWCSAHGTLCASRCNASAPAPTLVFLLLRSGCNPPLLYLLLPSLT